MPKGKILKYPDPKVMLEIGLAYIEKQKQSKEPILYSGLLLALDISRETFGDYEQRETHSAVVKRLKLEVQRFIEHQAYKGKSPIFPIFALKNFGWTDTQQLQVEAKEPMSISWLGRKGVKKAPTKAKAKE